MDLPRQDTEVSHRRREYVDELVRLMLHTVALQTAYLVGQIEGQESARGNFNDLLIAAAAIEQGYSVLTENLHHFEKIPVVQVLKL